MLSQVIFIIMMIVAAKGTGSQEYFGKSHREMFDEIPRQSHTKGVTQQEYKIRYVVDDKKGHVHYHIAESIRDGVVRGCYGYTNKNGIYRRVEYIADHGGYRVLGLSEGPRIHIKNRPRVKMNISPPLTGTEYGYKNPCRNVDITPKWSENSWTTKSTKGDADDEVTSPGTERGRVFSKTGSTTVSPPQVFTDYKTTKAGEWVPSKRGSTTAFLPQQFSEYESTTISEKVPPKTEPTTASSPQEFTDYESTKAGEQIPSKTGPTSVSTPQKLTGNKTTKDHGRNTGLGTAIGSDNFAAENQTTREKPLFKQGLIEKECFCGTFGPEVDKAKAEGLTLVGTIRKRSINALAMENRVEPPEVIQKPSLVNLEECFCYFSHSYEAQKYFKNVRTFTVEPNLTEDESN